MSSPAIAAPGSVGYVELLRRNRNYRLLWFGEIVSLLGDWFNLIASASLVAQLTESGFAIGSLFVVRMLAPFIVSPIAGVIADRYDRRRILVATDVTRAITVCGFLLVREPGQVWLLYTLTAVQLGISGFFFPTKNAILPDIVSPRELGAANAISSATWSVMLAFGAALGGLVAGAWGNRPAFVLDALTFVASAVLILRIRYTQPPALEDTGRTIGAAMQQYFDGLRYLRRHTGILFIALHKGAVSLMVSGGFQVIQVTIAEQVFVIGQGGGISMGLMFALVGVGTGVGPIVARIFTGDRDRPLRIAILLGYFIAALGLALAAPLWSFAWVLFGTFLRGVGSGTVWVFSTQLLLQLVPNRVRGRVFATEFAILTLMNAAGAAAVGSALDTDFTLTTILLWMAALTLLPGLLWLLWLTVNRSLEIGDPRLEIGD